MAHRRTARLLLLAGAVAGCASTGFLMARPKVTLFGPAYPPKDSTAAIEVFQSQKPDRPYQEIARIEVGDTNDNWSMKQILIKAREIGADAVIIVGRSGAIRRRCAGRLRCLRRLRGVRNGGYRHPF